MCNVTRNTIADYRETEDRIQYRLQYSTVQYRLQGGLRTGYTAQVILEPTPDQGTNPSVVILLFNHNPQPIIRHIDRNCVQ